MPEKPYIEYCLTVPKSACSSGRCPMNYDPYASVVQVSIHTDLEENIDGSVCPEAYDFDAMFGKD